MISKQDIEFAEKVLGDKLVEINPGCWKICGFFITANEQSEFDIEEESVKFQSRDEPEDCDMVSVGSVETFVAAVIMCAHRNLDNRINSIDESVYLDPSIF